MEKLRELMERKDLSIGEVARLTGEPKSKISGILRGNYPGRMEEQERLIVEKLLEALGEGGSDMEATPGKLKVRPVFIQTRNVQRFEKLCSELMDPEAVLGPSLAAVIGRAGRGKTEAARHHAVMNDAIYIRFMGMFSAVDLLREVAHELDGVRPRTTRACLNVIEKEMGRGRRLIIVDEADRMPISYIHVFRDLNERCACPVIFIGEEGLKAKLASQRRISSRTRAELEFAPVTSLDVSTYWKQAVGIALAPEVTKALHKRSGGDFRLVVKDALALVRVLNANETTQVTMAMVKGLEGGS